MLEIQITLPGDSLNPRYSFHRDGVPASWDELTDSERLRALYALKSCDKYLKTINTNH